MKILRSDNRPLRDIEMRQDRSLRPTENTYYFDALDAAGDAETRTPFYYLALLRENARKVVVFATLGLFLAWLVTLIQTRSYRSTAAIEIQSMSQSEALYGIIERDWAAGGSRDALPPEAYLQTQLELLNGRSFMSRVFDILEARPRLEGNNEPANPLLAALFRAGLYSAESSSANELPEVDMEVTVRPSTRIVDITAESTDPAFAAEVANTVAQEFIDYSLESQSQTAEQTMTWLRGQLEEMRVRVVEAEARLQDYSDEVGLVFEADQPEAEKQKLDELQRQLSAASVARIDRQSTYEVAASDSGTAILGMAEVDRQRTELAQLESELAEMKKVFTNKHRDVVALENRIESLRTLIESRVSDAIAGRRSEYEAARLREKYLGDAYYSQLNRTSFTAEKAVRYEELASEVDRNRNLYENLLEKATALSISAAMRASSQIRFVETALPPVDPFSPRLPINLAFGFMTGVMCALALIWTSDFSDQLMRIPGESESMLRLPELGSIPLVSGVGRLETRPKRGPIKRLKNLILGDAPQGEGGGLEKSAWLAPRTAHFSATAVTEAFHGVVASVLSSLRQGNDYRTLLVTSTHQGDGKTSVSSQLACALAAIGHKTVLVDCDFRAASLHTVFGTTNDRGLSTLFRAEKPGGKESIPLDEESVQSIISPTKIDRLFIVAAGPRPDSTPTALHSPRLGEIVRRLREQFDFVILDTPPLLEVSDARILGRHADAAILVVRSGKTSKNAALTVKRRLSEDGLPILGVVLNGWSPRGATSSYYT